MRTDLVCGVVVLLVAAAFWVQRDFDDPLAGAFPNLVLVVLVLCGLGILALAWWRGDRTRNPREVDLLMLAVTIVLVLGWGVTMGLIGFSISGVVAFTAMALLVRHEKPRLRTVVQDLAVAVVVVAGCFFVFTRGLLVPLPVSTLIGM